MLPGVTQSRCNGRASRRAPRTEATFAVTAVTPQSGVSHTFAFDPSNSDATVSLDNTYLRWLQIDVDQYAPAAPRSAPRST